MVQPAATARAILRKSAWRPLLRAEEGAELLAPIIAFLDDENGKPLVEVEPEELATVREAPAGLIVPSVEAISTFCQARRGIPQRVVKTGRDSPAPAAPGAMPWRELTGAGFSR